VREKPQRLAVPQAINEVWSMGSTPEAVEDHGTGPVACSGQALSIRPWSLSISAITTSSGLGSTRNSSSCILGCGVCRLLLQSLWSRPVITR
jgi:hypothetical protein